MPKLPINLEKIVLYRIYDRRNNYTYKVHYTTNFNQQRKNFKLDIKKKNDNLFNFIRLSGAEHFNIEEIKKNPVNNMSQLEDDIYRYRGGLNHLINL